MGQMAAVFQACDPRLARLSDFSGIGACHASGRVPVWDPVLLRSGHPEIPEDWSVTSDSLALWLACAIGARRVAILKSVDPAPGADPAALSRQGIVDGAFPAFAARFSGGIDILGPGRWGEMLRALRGADDAGSGSPGPGSARSRSTAA
jgi:5-(aminomethyl)-3-furanmethanol phosphate kinase